MLWRATDNAFHMTTNMKGNMVLDVSGSKEGALPAGWTICDFESWFNIWFSLAGLISSTEPQNGNLSWTQFMNLFDWNLIFSSPSFTIQLLPKRPPRKCHLLAPWKKIYLERSIVTFTSFPSLFRPMTQSCHHNITIYSFLKNATRFASVNDTKVNVFATPPRMLGTFNQHLLMIVVGHNSFNAKMELAEFGVMLWQQIWIVACKIDLKFCISKPKPRFFPSGKLLVC